MLVLSRHAGEKIIINPGPDQIVITVVDVARGKVRVGVSCARSIPIWRAEIRPQQDQQDTQAE